MRFIDWNAQGPTVIERPLASTGDSALIAAVTDRCLALDADAFDRLTRTMRCVQAQLHYTSASHAGQWLEPNAQLDAEAQERARRILHAERGPLDRLRADVDRVAALVVRHHVDALHRAEAGEGALI